MMQIKILASADTHLGYRQYGLIKRKQDMLTAFTQLVETAVRENYDAITISGDLLDSTRPSPDVFQFLLQTDQQLREKKIPCLVSVGNHDYCSPHWIELLGSKSEYGFQLLNNTSFQVKGINVYGQTFTNKKDFDRGARVPEDIHLLLMHQAFQEFAHFPGEKMFTATDLSHLHAAAVVVGDIHVHKDFPVATHHGTTLRVFSPGSTEFMSSSEEGVRAAYKLVFNEQGALEEFDNEFIKSRLVLRFNLESEDDFESCVRDLKECESDEPLVFLQFRTDIPSVMSRLRTLLNLDKYIIRPLPVSPDAAVLKEADKAEGKPRDMTFADIIMITLENRDHLHQIATRLMDKNVDVQEALDEFIVAREKELNVA